jgi:hypothetical protein
LVTPRIRRIHHFGNPQLLIIPRRVIATANPQLYEEKNKELEKEIHNRVRDLFLGVQVASHMPFNLSSHPTTHRQHSDGICTVMTTATLDAVLVAEKIDVRILDSEGNVVSDTRALEFRQKATAPAEAEGGQAL